MNDLNSEKEFLSEKEWLEEFIKVYKEHPPLWDDSSPQFPHRSSKKRGYNALLKVWHKKDKNGAIDDVRKKINSLKTSYRRELRKLKKSEEANILYEPSVWWFDMMHLGIKQRDPIPEHSNASIASTSSQAVNEISEEECTPPQPKKEKTMSREEMRSPLKKIQQEEDEYDYLGKMSEEKNKCLKPIPTKQDGTHTVANKSFTREDDEYDLLGKLWAKKIRKMSNIQKVLAEKYIHDIIFQGEIGLLAYEESVD